MTDSNDHATGLPILKSWPAVYIFVSVLCIAYLIGLALLSGHSW